MDGYAALKPTTAAGAKQGSGRPDRRSQGQATSSPADCPGIRRRWVLLVFGVAVALQALFWTGTIASDDLGYFQVAREFNGQRSDQPDKQIVYARTGIWYPLRMTTWVVGDTWLALVPTPFLATLGTLLFVWLLGLRCFDPRVGLLAVLALALTPYTIVSATVAMPDVVCGLFMIAGLAVGAPALLDRPVPRSWLRCLAAGFLFGVGYSAKEYAVLMLPGCAIFIVFFRTRAPWAWTRLAVICLGALAWLGVEGVVMWRMTGDPLFHPHVIASSQRAWPSPVEEYTLRQLYWYWTGIPRWLLSPYGPNAHFGWWGPVYVAGMVLALVRRPAASWLVFCCLAFQGLYQCAGTVDLTSYWPMWHQPRYLVPLFPLGAVLIGHAASWLWGHRSHDQRAAIAVGGGGDPDDQSTVSRFVSRIRRPALVAIAAFLIYQSIVLANRECRHWGASSTFFAARDLLAQPEPPWPADARMCASSQTIFRIGLLLEAAGFEIVEAVPPAPATPEEWRQRYAGCYVWVTRADRNPLFHTYTGLLDDATRTALGHFERVASGKPPASRLNQVFAWLGLVQPRYLENDSVDVYFVPPDRHPPDRAAARADQADGAWPADGTTMSPRRH